MQTTWNKEAPLLLSKQWSNLSEHKRVNLAERYRSRAPGQNDLFPFWVAPDGKAKIERHIPALPHSRETIQQKYLKRSLVLYRMVFGQNRQEDLIEYLLSRLSPNDVEKIVELCRIDLSPPRQVEWLEAQSSYPEVKE